MATSSDDAVTAGDGAPAEPYYEQKPFMGASKRFYGFISGTGAGKTFAGIYRLVANAVRLNPGHMGAIVVPDKGMFVDNVKPIMEEFGLLDRWTYQSVHSTEPGLVTEYGDRILILSADNQRQIGRLKGKNLAYVWMDEEAEIPVRAREIAQQRLRVGPYPNLFITTTPEGKNHTFDFFAGDVSPREYQHGQGTIYEAEDRLAIVGVPPEANPAIRDADIASMRRNLPDHVVAQEIEGQFVEVGAGVFTPDMLSFIHKSEIGTDRLKPIIAVDPAATVDAQRAEATDSDYWAATVVQAAPHKDRIYVTETVRRRGMTLREGVEWIARIAGSARDAHVVCEANQSQRWLIDELHDIGVAAEPVTSTREKEQRILDLSIPLENDTIQFVDWNAESPEDAGVNHPYGDLVEELLAFPDGSHDDVIDSLHRACDVAPVSLGVNVLGADPYGERGEDPYDEG